MAKKKAPEAWPWRIRGIYVLFGISLLVNAITLATLVKMAS